jgi:hypothetical protein
VAVGQLQDSITRDNAKRAAGTGGGSNGCEDVMISWHCILKIQACILL